MLKNKICECCEGSGRISLELTENLSYDNLKEGRVIKKKGKNGTLYFNIIRVYGQESIVLSTGHDTEEEAEKDFMAREFISPKVILNSSISILKKA